MITFNSPTLNHHCSNLYVNYAFLLLWASVIHSTPIIHLNFVFVYLASPTIFLCHCLILLAAEKPLNTDKPAGDTAEKEKKESDDRDKCSDPAGDENKPPIEANDTTSESGTLVFWRRRMHRLHCVLLALSSV